MAPPEVVSFPEETLQKMYENLEDKKEWDNICDLCTLPSMLHTDVQGNMGHVLGPRFLKRTSGKNGCNFKKE